MKNIIHLFVKRPVTTLMLILIIIAFGVLSLTNLKLDLMPNMNIPVAIIYTSYSGAGSEEMENLVTIPIEESMSTISGAKDITSTSSNGTSMVVLTFEDGTDLNFATLDMRENLDLVSAFLPEDANEPMIMKLDINSMTQISIGISSDTVSLTELQSIVENDIVPNIEQQGGVASVSVSGGTKDEIVVELIPDKMRGYGINPSTIQGLLYSENQNTATGSVREGNNVLPLRVEGEFTSIEDISLIPITTPTGGLIHLRDIANVYKDEVERTSYAYINDSASIILNIQKESDANTVEVSNAIIKEIAKLNNSMDNVDIEMLQDPGDYIRLSINSVAQSAIFGGLVALIILFLFLKDVRTTLIVGIAMPISIISTFFLMHLSGITINIMSLGGLTLGVGMLVDNSIVVVESIFRKIEEGEDKIRASIDGASEVAMSVIASTLTTIVVFLPITFQGGVVAEIFNSLSFTISFSLFSSLFVALTFVPMASSLFLIPESEKLQIGPVYKLLTKFNHQFEKLESFYKSLLNKAITHRKAVYIIVAAFFVITSLMASRIPMAYMPETDEGILMVNVSLPKGTDLEVTTAKAEEIVNILLEKETVEKTSMTIGGGGVASAIMGASSDSASIIAFLTPAKERSLTIGDIQKDFKSSLGNVAGAEITISNPSSVSVSDSSSVAITVRGDDLDTLYEISDSLIELGENIEGVESVSTSVEDTISQANIVMNRDKAMIYGITSSSISSTLDTAINGKTATTFKTGDGNELDVVITQDADKYNYIMDVENILIPTATGSTVPLYEIAETTVTQQPPSIARENQQRYITVSLKSDGAPVSTIIKNFELAMKEKGQLIIPQGYSWEYSGTTEEMYDTFTSLALALLMAIVLVYMVMAAEFESFMFPFIVMFAIPIAITGGIFGLGVVGEDLTITSFLGMIMLSGLVINNAIVLIDYINLLIKERSKTLQEAILIAGPVRLRPIVMSVLTTSLGLLPMALSQAQGSELMRGLAFIVIFGLLASTIVTLVLIPVIYSTMYNKKEKHNMKKAEKRKKHLEKIKLHNQGK
ncbi:MAG: efflux RND transporter permease subunit [Lachnospirales bacterium]